MIKFLAYLAFFLPSFLMATEPINKLWDFNDPKASEERFRSRLAEEENNRSPLETRMEIMTQIARAESLQQKFDEAHKTLDTVEVALKTLHSPLVETRYYLERGRAFNSSNHPKEAKEEFLNALKAAEKVGFDYYAIDAIHMIAIANPDSSLEWSERGIKMAETSKEERAKLWLGTFYNNTGWTYFNRKQYQTALELFVKYEKECSKRNDEPGARIAKWSQAKMHRFMGNLDKSLSMQLDLEKDINEGRMDTDGYVYEEIAECLLAQGKKEESRKYFNQAYDLLSKDIWLARDEKGRLERLKSLGE
jgi:tetratricopeptide (TPR) repeat protein